MVTKELTAKCVLIQKGQDVISGEEQYTVILVMPPELGTIRAPKDEADRIIGSMVRNAVKRYVTEAENVQKE